MKNKLESNPHKNPKHVFMQLRETILAGHSKAQTEKIVAWTGSSQQHFDQLFYLFLTDDYRVMQRAAWPLSYCVIQHPAFIKKHLENLLGNLQKQGAPSAVKRNTLRLLQHIQIPEAYHGQVMNVCFEYILSATEDAAIKAFALTVLQNLAELYPEIYAEVKVIIEDRWQIESPAFKSGAKKFLASKTEKIKNQQKKKSL